MPKSWGLQGSLQGSPTSPCTSSQGGAAKVAEGVGKPRNHVRGSGWAGAGGGDGGRACARRAELAAVWLSPGQPGRPVQPARAGRAGARGGGSGRRRGAGPGWAHAAGHGGRQTGAVPPVGGPGAAERPAQPGPAQRHAGAAAGDGGCHWRHSALQRVAASSPSPFPWSESRSRARRPPAAFGRAAGWQWRPQQW
jgi:hypothetical protein